MELKNSTLFRCLTTCINDDSGGCSALPCNTNYIRKTEVTLLLTTDAELTDNAE